MKSKHLGERLTEDEIRGGQWGGKSAQLVQMLSELREQRRQHWFDYGDRFEVEVNIWVGPWEKMVVIGLKPVPLIEKI